MVTLDWLGTQVERVIDGQRRAQDQFASIHDQLTVLTAMSLSHERKLTRLEDRLDRLENRIERIEQRLEQHHDQT